MGLPEKEINIVFVMCVLASVRISELMFVWKQMAYTSKMAPKSQ